MKRIILALSVAATVLLTAGCGTLSGALKGMSVKTYTFYNLPETLQDLQALPEANLKDPYGVAALTVAALCRYETNPDDCFAMLDWLKGPESLSNYEKQFLRERGRISAVPRSDRFRTDFLFQQSRPRHHAAPALEEGGLNLNKA